MRRVKKQTGISLTGLIVLLLVFVVFSFGVGWFANTYYANRPALVAGSMPDFPSIVEIGVEADGLTWDGQNLLLSYRRSPWGLVRLTPLENGQFRKKTIPVVDQQYSQQVSFQGISWNGTSLIAISNGDAFQSIHRKVFVELDASTYKISRVIGEAPEHAHCMAWDGKNYWAGTRLNDANQQGQSVLYKFDQDLKLVDSYVGAGTGCQGMEWDGKFLWWGDAFTNTVTLFNIDNHSSTAPAVMHQYSPSIKQQAGITYDGKNIWFADAANHQLNILHQGIYFDWLGGDYEINNHAQLKTPEHSVSHQSADVSVDTLIEPLLQGNISVVDVAGYVDTLRTEYSNEEIRQLLNKAREKIVDETTINVLDQAIAELVARGNIDYQYEEQIEDDSVRIKYFSTAVENGQLVASWKVIAGQDIVSGIDAPRPQQIPDTYDFYTFIHYTININNLDTGENIELDYEFFDNEDERNDVLLLPNIKSAEYQINVDINAQYYTETTASHYNSELGIKLSH
jgi:hypothetical protein